MDVEDITRTLDEISWDYQVVTKHGVTLVVTHTKLEGYFDRNGYPVLTMVFNIEEQGGLLVLLAPYVRRVPHLNFSKITQLLGFFNQIHSEYKLVQCTLNPENGELRFAIEVPIAQATFHESIILRCILNLIDFMENYLQRIDEILFSPLDVV